MTLHYEFPVDITLAEVKSIVDENPNFILADKGDYLIANYVRAGKDTHPYVADRKSAIMRELRGLIFSKASGRVISRRYQKFFNFGERDDMMELDFSRNHVILEKLDGSMITPFPVNGNMLWGTKMGETDVSAQIKPFLEKNPQYDKFAMKCIEMGKTPIFEWTSNKQRIVLNYENDNLILVAIRDNYSGKYEPYASLNINAMCNQIPCVSANNINRVYSQSEFHELLNIIRAREGEEGVVILFDDGHMVKMKSDWYISIHRAKSLLENERDVVGIILDNKEDDLLSVLNKEDKDRLLKFTDEVWNSIYEFMESLDLLLHTTREMDRKEFSKYTELINPVLRSFGFKFFDNRVVDINEITDYIKKKLGSNRTFEVVRSIIPSRWKEVKLDE
jgi:RNA ligase